MTLPCTKVELRVYDRDGSTLRDTVSVVAGTQFTDPLGDIGSAQMAAPLVQAVLVSNPDLLQNAIVKVATNLTGTSTMTEVFGFLAEGGEWDLITAQEDAGKQRALQCRGLLALMGDWVVYPETGIHAHSADNRAFGWMSAESSHWFDSSQWSGTIHATEYKDVGVHADRYHKPKGWPDKKAAWVGTNNKAKQYFRTKVTVDTDTPVRVYASADENIRVFLDSELIISNNSHETGYTELNVWRGTLTAGTHTFGIKYLKNFTTPGEWGLRWDFSDSDKMIFTCCSIGADGSIDTVLRRSSDSSRWLAVGLDNGTRPPTWSAAGIVGKLVAEARARGVDSATRITLGFTDTADSSSSDWSDLHERSWPVGTSGSQVLSDLAELDIDWDMLPDLTLNGYESQGSDKSADVAITQGVNILTYKAGVTPLLATSLLVRSHNGWLQVTDTDAEDVSDRREAFLQTGSSLSHAQAKHAGNRALESMSSDQISYTAEIIAVDGCVPYHDFGKGDTIMAYDRTMTATPMRVVSISGAMPDDGPIRWTLELEVP